MQVPRYWQFIFPVKIKEGALQHSQMFLLLPKGLEGSCVNTDSFQHVTPEAKALATKKHVVDMRRAKPLSTMFHYSPTRGQIVMLQRCSSKACTHSCGSRTGTFIAAAARRPSAFLHCKSHFTWVGNGEARLLKCFFTRSLWQFCKLLP